VRSSPAKAEFPLEPPAHFRANLGPEMAVAGGRRNIPDRAVISTAATTLTVCIGMKNRTSADAQRRRR